MGKTRKDLLKRIRELEKLKKRIRKQTRADNIVLSKMMQQAKLPPTKKIHVKQRKLHVPAPTGIYKLPKMAE